MLPFQNRNEIQSQPFPDPRANDEDRPSLDRHLQPIPSVNESIIYAHATATSTIANQETSAHLLHPIKGQAPAAESEDAQAVGFLSKATSHSESRSRTRLV